MNNEYDMIDMIDGETDFEVLEHLNVSWEESEDMDSPDHDDIVGWNEDGWGEEEDVDEGQYYDDWKYEDYGKDWD
jgi:hypothetical protein